MLNTTHVEDGPDVPPIEATLLAHGLDPSCLHPDGRTAHPRLPRLDALEDWLKRHPEVTQWVDFDNEVFMASDGLIWVDPDSGLTLSHLNQALTAFGEPEVAIHV